MPSPRAELKTVARAEKLKGVGFDDSKGRRALIEANALDDSFLSALASFSYATADELLTMGGNVNYSPLSLYCALSIAASGAKGDTQSELLALLGQENDEALRENVGKLIRLLNTDNEIAKLKIADSLWLDANTPFKDGFPQLIADELYADVYSADFTSPETGKAMGQWISDRTNGLLAPELSTDGQIMAIINTVYYYDEWIDVFNEDRTAEDVFHRSDGTDVSVDFMNRTYGTHGFAKGDGYTRSSLSLKDTGSMVFILPDEGVTPQELIAGAGLETLLTGGERGNGEVVFKIPKFSFGSDMKLADTLKKLGVNRAFEMDADFSDIAGGAYISSVIQQTRISINEKGVEAAAFTNIAYAGAAPPNDRADMILDRPFIYAITSDVGAPMFVGVVDDPS